MKRYNVWQLAILIVPIALVCAWIGNERRAGRLAWAAAQRTQCVNNLKQIGIALGQYSSPPAKGAWCYGLFPPGTLPAPSVAPDRRCGWASLISAENDECCSGCPMIHRDIPWDDSRQTGASGRDHAMFCPSLPRTSPSGRFVPAAYIGIAGLGVDAPSLPKSDRRAGIFGDDRIVAPADVVDGLGQTMMVAESSVAAGPWFAGSRETVRGLDPARQPYLGRGRQFGGIHGEGANVLMADGSVRYLRETVAPKVLEAVSTIAGGETVSVP